MGTHPVGSHGMEAYLEYVEYVEALLDIFLDMWKYVEALLETAHLLCPGFGFMG